ncbi:Vascular endothelial growth factor receptor kdr-like [Halotydeus destructor]|nr:Vascular endothelial growth factor receptor kdr-like [Halotydeus destructor]
MRLPLQLTIQLITILSAILGVSSFKARSSICHDEHGKLERCKTNFASVTDVTRREPKEAKAEDKPKLICATTQRIYQLSDDIFVSPIIMLRMNDFSLKNNVTAMDVHHLEHYLFYADTTTAIKRLSLREENLHQRQTIVKGKECDFEQIHQLSVDWLNNKLYIADNRKISRCDLEGYHMETLIELQLRPVDMHVDPYNGYLFFTVSGPPESTMAGLYRVDLSKFTSRKVVTLQDAEVENVIREPTISVFTLNVEQFQIYYPKTDRQGITSIVATSLDGKHKSDLRPNKLVDKPLSSLSFKSIVHYNETFMWTNGTLLFREEYNDYEKKYVVNDFDIADGYEVVSLRVRHNDTQKFPNPLRRVQDMKSLFTIDHAMIVWSAPPLVHGRSHGSWQNWEYEISIRENKTGSVEHISRINDTRAEIKDLEPDTSYVLKVRAVSPGGKGEWSEPLVNRTFKEETPLPQFSFAYSEWSKPPSTPEIRDETLNTNEVCWNKSESFGAPTVFYELFMAEADLENWILVYNGSHQCWAVREVLTEHRYNLRIRARSINGLGEYSKKNVTLYFENASPMVGPANDNVMAAIAALCVFFMALLCGAYLFNSRRQRKVYNNKCPASRVNELVPLPFLPGHPHKDNSIYLPGFVSKLEQERRQHRSELKRLQQGQLDMFNPDIPLDQQVDLLPYDRRWEFPIDNLRFGLTLGQGAFGRVVKAEAIGLQDDEPSSTVAVKMLKEKADLNQRKALMSELKIMIHLGCHLNIVNLLGAVTTGIAKGELMVMVEYCRFGNLRHYLLAHRKAYVDQINPETGLIDGTVNVPRRTYVNGSIKNGSTGIANPSYLGAGSRSHSSPGKPLF